MTLAQAYCYLSQFTAGPIAPEKMAAIEADFAKARAWGVKYLLRFLYKGSGRTAVAPVARIRAHMEQLKPLQAGDLDTLRFPYSPDYFAGAPRRAFEYVRDHLGYRLEARRAVYDAAVAPGALFEAETVLVNHGFATMINPRVPCYVLYRDDGTAIEMPAAPNGRHYQPYRPGDAARTPLEHVVSCAFRLPDALPAGRWKLALWLPDARESLRYRADYAVRLANNLAWVEDRAGRGMQVIGEVVVSAVPDPCTSAGRDSR